MLRIFLSADGAKPILQVTVHNNPTFPLDPPNPDRIFWKLSGTFAGGVSIVQYRSVACGTRMYTQRCLRLSRESATSDHRVKKNFPIMTFCSALSGKVGFVIRARSARGAYQYIG